MFSFLKQRRRRQLRARDFPPEWLSIIGDNFSMFRRLPPEDQTELLGHVQVFLAEKFFEGCGGLEITDEVRVTIAAQACLLLLHRQTDYFPRLVTVLVYPSGYLTYEKRHLEGNIWEEGREYRLGQTGRQLGSLVLSWEDVKRGALDSSGGRNVVLHEFAHQLDYEDFETDGAPALGTRSEYRAWAHVMNREFKELRAAEQAGMSTVLDPYGATNVAEFFAVATEAFFVRPRALRARHPELYDQFARFFRQDPVRYSVEPPTGVSPK